MAFKAVFVVVLLAAVALAADAQEYGTYVQPSGQVHRQPYKQPRIVKPTHAKKVIHVVPKGAPEVKVEPTVAETRTKPVAMPFKPTYAQPRYAQPQYAQPRVVAPAGYKPSYTQPRVAKPVAVAVVQPTQPQRKGLLRSLIDRKIAFIRGLFN